MQVVYTKINAPELELKENLIAKKLLIQKLSLVWITKVVELRLDNQGYTAHAI